MKRSILLAMSMAVVTFFGSQKVAAAANFYSWNHAVSGGRLDFKGRDIKCFPARFSKDAEHREGGASFSRFAAILPCDLSGGGYLTIEVNGRPTRFQVPPGIIRNETEVRVVVRNAPFYTVWLAKEETHGFDQTVDFYPLARGGKCIAWGYVQRPREMSDEEYSDHKQNILKRNLALHSLSCEEE